MTAADLAGPVGDILAELGVVVIPQLQSISTEPPRSSSERIARIVMNYRFVDARSGEELTVRVAGEGADAGDKAPYKAMTGALKYALLQSFLLATGDDPDERADSRAALGSERVITPEQVRELQGLIEETGTELDWVLAYYRISALDEMTEGSYRRALDCHPQTRQTEQPGERSRCPESNGCNRTRRTGTVGASRGSAPAMSADHGRGGLQNAANAVVDKTAVRRRMRRGRRRGAGASWSGARGGPTSRKLASRWSRGAWCTTTGMDACIARRPELRRVNCTEIKRPMNVRDQTAAQQGSVPPNDAQLQHQLEVSRRRNSTTGRSMATREA